MNTLTLESQAGKDTQGVSSSSGLKWIGAATVGTKVVFCPAYTGRVGVYDAGDPDRIPKPLTLAPTLTLLGRD